MSQKKKKKKVLISETRALVLDSDRSTKNSGSFASEVGDLDGVTSFLRVSVSSFVKHESLQPPHRAMWALNIGVTKKFIWAFLYHLMEKPEQTFWPSQYYSAFDVACVHMKAPKW